LKLVEDLELAHGLQLRLLPQEKGIYANIRVRKMDPNP